ncbi:MAG: WG repeat-containing protein [Clostridia bacterium]|nr:WG repeat-containing protein [Clostridia bacterium]
MAFAVYTLCSCGFEIGGKDDETTASVIDENNESTDGSDTAPPDSDKEEIEPEPEKDPNAIPVLYTEAIESYISSFPWDENGPPLSGGNLFSWVDSLDSIGYAIIQIDGKGEPELVISEGSFVYDIFTISSEGALVHLMSSGMQTPVYLLDDGSLCMIYGTAVSQSYELYNINEDCDGIELSYEVKLDIYEAIDAGIYKDVVEAQEDYCSQAWFYTEKESGDDRYLNITESQAESLVPGDEKKLEINDIPLSEYDPSRHEFHEESDGTSTDTSEPYRIVYESNLIFEDIQPIYECGCINGIPWCLYALYPSNRQESAKVIDFEGNVYYCGDASYITYCPFFASINGDHSYGLDPYTLEINDNAGGHGVFIGSTYYFEEDTGELYAPPEGIGAPPELCESFDGFVIVEAVTLKDPEDIDISDPSDIFHLTGKYGIVIDSELVVPCEHEMYLDYWGGICALRKDGKWGYFNEKGEQILDFEYSASVNTIYNHFLQTSINVPYHPLSGLLVLCKDGKWGYSDLDGNMVTGFEFEEARPATYKNAWVKQDGVWKVIEFAKHGGGISPSQAKEVLIQWLNDRGDPYSVTLLPEEKWKCPYLTKHYTFEVDWHTQGEDSITTYMISFDGEITSLIACG